MAGSHADRDLLFEALAIHLGFVGRDALEEARRARPDDADPNAGFAPALGEILVARNVLAADRCAVLDGLVDDLLTRHGGDVKGCLDALSAFGRLRRELERRPAREGSWHPTLPSIPIGGMGLAEDEAEARSRPEGANGESARIASAPEVAADDE